MSLVALELARTDVLSAAGLIAWVGLAMALADDDLQSFVALAPDFPDAALGPYGITRSG